MCRNNFNLSNLLVTLPKAQQLVQRDSPTVRLWIQSVRTFHAFRCYLHEIIVKGHIPFICLPVISKISNTRLNTKYKSARFLFPWAVNKQLFFWGGGAGFCPCIL